MFGDISDEEKIPIGYPLLESVFFCHFIIDSINGRIQINPTWNDEYFLFLHIRHLREVSGDMSSRRHDLSSMARDRSQERTIRESRKAPRHTPIGVKEREEIMDRHDRRAEISDGRRTPHEVHEIQSFTIELREEYCLLLNGKERCAYEHLPDTIVQTRKLRELRLPHEKHEFVRGSMSGDIRDESLDISTDICRIAIYPTIDAYFHKKGFRVES